MSDATDPRRPADAPSPSRRALLGGVAAAAVAGAGAGAGMAALLHDDPAPPGPRLAAGSSPGGDGRPWHVVEPGGSIQDTIDAGARAILLGDGEYRITEPLRPTPGCTIRGIGARTRLVAAADLEAVIAVGAGGPSHSVVVADLTVDAAGRAKVGIDLDLVGTADSGEPDGMCRLDGLWVSDAAEDGIAYRGRDTQATISTRIRVRRAGRHGFRVEAPDNVFLACEATTKGTGGAGFYVGTAIDGSDGIGGGNNHFQACKAWYCHGVGWHVAGSRNLFVGCEAQDTASHGWLVDLPHNAFSTCSADTAGMADVGGRPDRADGFRILPGAETTFVGCLAFDRRPGGSRAGQRYGFSVPASLVADGLLVGHTGWGNLRGLVERR